MITQSWMSPVADAAAARYAAVLEGFGHVYRTHAARGDLGSARAMNRIAEELVQIAKPFADGELGDLHAALVEAAETAQTATSHALGMPSSAELTDAASEAVSAIYEHLASEIAAQMMRDVAATTQALRRHAIQVQLSARVRGVPLATAALQHRIGGLAQPSYGMNDRGGARWTSRRLIRVLVRHALLSAYNDAALATIAGAGQDRAEVRHASPDAEVDGMILAIAPDSDLPTYAEVRADVFHPNADAILVPLGCPRC